MYSVVASDGKVYGPVDMPTLRQWSQEGRIAADTLLLDPISGRQLRASEVHDLFGLFSSGQPPTARTQVMQQPGQPFQGTHNWQHPPAPSMPAPDWNRPPQPMPFHPAMYGSKSKVAAALLAAFFGVLGVHRFYLGHTSTGAAMLGLTILTPCTFGGTLAIAGIWTIIDFILILTDGLLDVNGARLT